MTPRRGWASEGGGEGGRSKRHAGGRRTHMQLAASATARAAPAVLLSARTRCAVSAGFEPSRAPCSRRKSPHANSCRPDHAARAPDGSEDAGLEEAPVPLVHHAASAARSQRASTTATTRRSCSSCTCTCACTRSTMTRPPTERRLCTTLHRCECVDTSSTRRAAPSGGRLHNELPLQRGWPARKKWTEIVSGRFLRLPNASSKLGSLQFIQFQNRHANTHLGRARAEPGRPGAHAHASYAWPAAPRSSDDEERGAAVYVRGVQCNGCARTGGSA